MMMKRLFLALALPLALAGFGCGDSGGEITGDAALQGVMQRIALDFAQILVDVAPDTGAVFSQKGLAGTTADCPDDGTATYSDSGGGGTLSLGGCTIRGVTLDGTLFGFIFTTGTALEASNLNGQLMVSGGATANLNVQNLIVSAQLPITDEGTFWQIEAITEDNEMLCAWSGGGPCEDIFQF